MSRITNTNVANADFDLRKAQEAEQDLIRSGHTLLFSANLRKARSTVQERQARLNSFKKRLQEQKEGDAKAQGPVASSATLQRDPGGGTTGAPGPAPGPAPAPSQGAQGSMVVPKLVPLVGRTLYDQLGINEFLQKVGQVGLTPVKRRLTYYEINDYNQIKEIERAVINPQETITEISCSAFNCPDLTNNEYYYCEYGHLRPVWRLASIIYNDFRYFLWYNNRQKRFVDYRDGPNIQVTRRHREFFWQWDCTDRTWVKETAIPNFYLVRHREGPNIFNERFIYSILHAQKQLCPPDDPYDLTYDGFPIGSSLQGYNTKISPCQKYAYSKSPLSMPLSEPIMRGGKSKKTLRRKIRRYKKNHKTKRYRR
jgi:hypothetical protein